MMTDIIALTVIVLLPAVAIIAGFELGRRFR